jgi:hypothetical protein
MKRSEICGQRRCVCVCDVRFVVGGNFQSRRLRVRGGGGRRTAMQVGKPASLRMPSEDMVWEILRSGFGRSIGCFSSFRLSAGRSIRRSEHTPNVRPHAQDHRRRKWGMKGWVHLEVPKHVECWQLELFHAERGSLAAVRSVLPERQRGLYSQTRECERCQSATHSGGGGGIKQTLVMLSGRRLAGALGSP